MMLRNDVINIVRTSVLFGIVLLFTHLLTAYLLFGYFETGCDIKLGRQATFNLVFQFVVLPTSIVSSFSLAVGMARYRPSLPQIAKGIGIFCTGIIVVLIIASRANALTTLMLILYVFLGPFLVCRLMTKLR